MPLISIRDDLHNVRVVLHFDEDDTYDRLWGHVECKSSELNLTWRWKSGGRYIDHHMRFYLSSARGFFLRWQQWWSASRSGNEVPVEPRSVMIRHDRRPRLSLTCGITDRTWHFYQSEHFDVQSTADLLLTKADA